MRSKVIPAIFCLLALTLLVLIIVGDAAPMNEGNGQQEKGKTEAGKKKTAQMNTDKKGNPRKERGKEEKERLKAEKEKVKALLAKHRNSVNEEVEKMAKEQANDERLKSIVKELKAARAKNPNETRSGDLGGKSEAAINEARADELHEGDIKLTLAQAEALFGGEESGNGNGTSSKQGGRKRRAAPLNMQNFPSNQWADAYVPYSFDGSATINSMKSAIYKAINLWNANTCLYLAEDPSASPRIEFTASNGCSSNIGAITDWTYQEIDLSTGCIPFGRIAHEIAHALGYFHEQSRYDRDSFVWTYLNNVQQTPVNYTNNFLMESQSTNNNLGKPYDLGSVMHYDAWAFTKDPSLNTLIPKTGAQYIDTIGQRFGPAHYDYMVMNMLYCGLSVTGTSSMNSVSCISSTTCYNGGFQNPNTCNTCICPPGYSGPQCLTIQTAGYAPSGVTNTCTGNTIKATSAWQDLTGQIGSSTLNSNEDYAFCHWQLTADAGKTLQLQVTQVGPYCSSGCVWGNTEIRTDADKGRTGVRLCCSSDLGSTGQLTINAPNGYAMVSLYAFRNTQSFKIRFMQV